MTGARYAEWRHQRKYVVSMALLLTAICSIALFSADEAGIVDIPGPSAHEALYDHPIVTLCLIFLLCLLCVVLYLSRVRIQASERRYRAIFQDNGAVMLLIDPDTLLIKDANPAACVFYGWKPADILTMRITEICTLEEAVIREVFLDVLNYEKRRFRARHRLASGEERDVEVNAMPYRVDDRDCLFSIVHDITTDRNESGRAPWQSCSTR